MKKLLVFLILSMVNYGLLAQIISSNIDRPYNKKLAHYKAKEYLIDNVFADDNTNNNETVEFSIDPISSSVSGDLISLVYDCPQRNKRGIIFGFFFDRWDPKYLINPYGFKSIPQAKAKELFKKIEKEIEKNRSILRGSKTLNYYFKFEDFTIIIYDDDGLMLRVMWNDYDALWNFSAYRKAKKTILE
tara:strand:- start:39 stop:602 length:564 start_codon:yes stop_codon:yes gene_type:complete